MRQWFEQWAKTAPTMNDRERKIAEIAYLDALMDAARLCTAKGEEFLTTRPGTNTAAWGAADCSDAILTEAK